MSIATKVCATCGKAHAIVPENARLMAQGKLAGFYWECDCLSTLFVPVSKVIFIVSQEEPTDEVA